MFLFGRNLLMPSYKQCNVFIKVLHSTNQQMEDITTNELKVKFFLNNFGSNYSKWYATVKKYPDLKNLKKKDVLNTVNYLKHLNFTIDDILMKPTILYSSEVTLRNRYEIMKECGVVDIHIGLLAKYIAVINRTSEDLKHLCHLPLDADVKENLRQCFKTIDLKLPDNSDNSIMYEEMKLRLIRQMVLNSYLRQYLEMNTNEIEKVWKVYSRVRHKSFQSIQEMVALLLNDLKFTKERIRKNAFTLYGDAENVRQIIKNIPTISNQSILEILHKRPKIFMSPCDTLQTTLKNIKDYGLNEDCVVKCLEVLTLSSDTVLERLRDMNDVEEFQALKTNPRVLRLVHYQNKARLRLDYLNQMKVRCASLHILSCGSQIFAKFARDGTDRTRGRDTLVYLAKTLRKNENDLRNILNRHPNWCHVPITQIKQCYEFLLEQKFSVEEIYKNVYILLYPINRINAKLEEILSTYLLQELYLDVEVKTKSLSNNNLLKLVLYLIESEYHFTGDGIWTEQHSQQVENFHNLLPDFSENMQKTYKYGCSSEIIKKSVL